jgi:hypothetical protein
MRQREPTLLKRLLDRLLVTRARRDREARFTDAWQAADIELHEIERAIFRTPLGAAERVGSLHPGRPRSPGTSRARAYLSKGAGSRA